MNIEELFKKLGIQPKNKKLYEIAFSHSSYVNEHRLKSDYERLEFLGDKVLDVIISDYLYTTTSLSEGEMTKIRASYVCENACYAYASDLNFSKYIRVGHGEEHDGGRFKRVILADIFEAFCGSLYLDLGFLVAKKTILNIIIPYIEDDHIIFFSDYKSKIQEAIQTNGKNLNYVVLKEIGPAHSRKFEVGVYVDSILYGKGVGSSKKEAEQEAAKNALEKMAR